MTDPENCVILLCRALRPAVANAERVLLSQELIDNENDLTALAERASAQYLTPTLYCALRDAELLVGLPDALQTYLHGIYTLNLERNAHLRVQALDAAVTLNAVGVEPVLLKGGAQLFEPLHGDPGARMMIDIDMLVPAADFERSIAALQSAGYGAEDTAWTYHYPPLARPGERSTIELHVEAGEQRTVLPAEDALAAAVSIDTAGDVRLRALSPTHQVWHTIFHAQVQDRSYVLGAIPLRSLDDFAGLVARHGDRIDWGEIAERFETHGLERMLAAHAYQAERLFDVLIDPHRLGRGAPSLRTRLQYRRCLTQLRWPALGAAARGLGAVSHPFKRYHIELLYGRSDGWASLLAKRIRHAGRLVAKHRLGAFAKIALSKKTHYPS